MADWYVKTQDELGPWWANFLLRRPEFEDKYPILKTMEAELAAIGAWVAYWTATRHAFDEASKQLTRYFNTIAGNDPSEDPPSTFTFSLAGGAPAEVPPGIEFTIRSVRKETTGYSNYAKADGDALGFEAKAPANIIPADVKPTLNLHAAEHGYEVSLVVGGRNGVTNWDVYITRKGGSRTKLTNGEGKSCDIVVPPTTPGEAEQIQLDVQLRKSNANYGQPSNPVYVTINP